MAKKKNKRFYKEVGIAALGDGYTVTLDGATLKTPGKLTFVVPHKLMAELAAEEWAAQGKDIVPTSMPVTRLLNVAIEKTPQNRDALVAEARKYAATDLLCYREGKTRLYKAYQAENWDPVLTWAERQGVTLKITDSLVAIEQDEVALDTLERYARGLNDNALTLFVHLVAVFGSAILAMAVMERHLTGEQGFELSRLDEIWQIKYWGQDEMAQERTDTLRDEIIALTQLLEIDI